MENTVNKVPVWYWIIGVIALLWNFMGINAFYSDMTISQEALAALTPEHRGLYETMPMWVKAVFGGAVLLGTLGSIGLLLRKRWASILLGLSLVCVLAQMAHSFATDGYKIAGGAAMTMGMVVLAFAAFIALFARWSNTKGYLN